VTTEDIKNWMSRFGEVKGEIRYHLFIVDKKVVTLSDSVRVQVYHIKSQSDSVRVRGFLYFYKDNNLSLITSSSPVDSDGIGTDDWNIKIQLDQHIPELLPINGKRSLVYYPGIPKQCKRCFETGHTAPGCTNPKEDWLNYVVRFLQTNQFTESMVGGWIDALKKYHPLYNRADPKDLRQQLDLTRRGVDGEDLRRKIGPSTSRDLRTNIGENTEDNPGRGARGRGKPRGCFQNHHQSDHHHQNHHQSDHHQNQGRDNEGHWEQGPSNRGRGQRGRGRGQRGRGRGRVGRNRGWNGY